MSYGHKRANRNYHTASNGSFCMTLRSIGA